MWSKKEAKFVDADSDILEQKHLSNTRAEQTDFEMFVPCDLQPNEIGYVKVIKIDKVKDSEVPSDQSAAANTLAIEGISQDSEVLFLFKNK